MVKKKPFLGVFPYYTLLERTSPQLPLVNKYVYCKISPFDFHVHDYPIKILYIH